MADPFSIIAGTAGLADICIRTVKFLKAARSGFTELDRELEALSEEIVSLKSANNTVASCYSEIAKLSTNPVTQKGLISHWKTTEQILAGCKSVVEQLEILLKSILARSNGEHHKIDQFRKWLKHGNKEKDFHDLRQKLSMRISALHLILETSNVLIIRASQETSNESISGLARSLDNLGESLTSKINSLHNLHNVSSDTTLSIAVDAAKNAADNAYVNEHFFVPSSVSSWFTGRVREFEILEESLISKTFSEVDHVQRRFVLYGLAGSGKTQTCCKFALKNRSRFWGIFWLNASSKEHLKQSFVTLSEIPRVAPNEAAVKGWLSSLGSNRPWLLIIDNADDPDTLVEQSFPDNVYGSILVTTRNYALRTQGTVGPRYIEMSGLEESVSISLLLRITDEMAPWTVQAIDFAQKIAKRVGCLPLALTYAGNTIASRLCTLQTYLDFYERCWTRLRQHKNLDDSSPIQDASAVIYSSYELMHQSLAAKNTQASADALDLLKIFAFLDRQNIMLKIFTRAATRPAQERASERPEELSKKDPKPVQSWSKWCKSLIVKLVQSIQQPGSRPLLPSFLQSADATTSFDEFRLREAINELLKMSLISMTSSSDDRYTMHPAVHTWARQRPGMTLGDQAIWCHITANILSNALLLPPLDDTEEGETFRRELLPHVIHVQNTEQEIEKKFTQNRQNRQGLVPVTQSLVNSSHLVKLVKFSLVYYQGYRMQDAERLQAYVLEFLVSNIGLEDERTIGLLRLLSRTYFQLARMDEAVELQKKAYDACLVTFGRKHMETLQVMDQYGSALWLQGQIRASRAMHEATVETLVERFGLDDIVTLKAMIGLGRALCKDFAFEEAIQMNQSVFLKLKSKLGPSHSATLEAMDNLAMAYFDRTAYRRGQAGDLDQALELEEQVFKIRLESLGKEHYHTLWAGLNLARIRAVRGETDIALAIFLPGRAVVQRDLKPDHFLYLFTELHHARILMCAGKYEEAESILTEVIATHDRTRRTHPDRLLVAFSLIKCRRVLGKVEGVDELYQQLLDGAVRVFGPAHPAVNTILDENALATTTPDVYVERRSV